ncbi:DUF3558 domain-containing protein [Rhodococcus daqingensis]|uniref:DUF3558 domain-containing protein n=1 Tax=Rhodococcus daqingensis TaxID=2479363 RepID=A0ABW2S0M8_9NOCA
MRWRGLAGVGLACGALMLAGCGSESVAGEAEPVGAGSGEPVFSPCDDIPDEALRAVGMDPATESRDILGVKQPGWNLCRWNGPDHIMTVFATTHGLDDVRSNKRNTEFAPQLIGGREAFTYREVSDEDRESCDVAIGTERGAVLIRVSYNFGDRPAEDPCQVAVRSAQQLEPSIPQ